MAPIQTAEEAVEAAERFLDKYYVSRKLQTAMREGSGWTVEFDVGILNADIVRITLDAEAGAVTDYRKI